MLLSKIPLLLLGMCTICWAQANFRFYVFDEIKDEKMDYTIVQNVTIYDWDSDDPILMYDTDYRISGINQKDFSFTTERFQGSIPRKEYSALMDRARRLPTAKLKKIGKKTASGWIAIGGKTHDVSASSETEERKIWKAFIDEILTKHAPAPERKKVTRSIQGDTVTPLQVSFIELLKHPKSYNDKRIRITGFYHGEFEGSSFASSANEIRNYDNALWLGENSSFADPAKVARPNDQTLTIEGTFEFGPGGHLGGWMGELSRVTEIKKAEPDTTGQPTND